MYCTQCGEPVPQNATFCGNCGWQVAPMQTWRDEVRARESRGLKLCVKCRSEIPLDATVCHRCDARQPSYDPSLWAPVAERAIPGPGAAAARPSYAPPIARPTPPAAALATPHLATIGRRIGAYLIDIVVLVFIALIVVLALGIDPEDEQSQNEQIIIYAAITIVYFTLCEALTGQTAGKRLTGIRVVGVNGEPMTWGKSISRNLLRVVDSLPALYIVGLIVMSRSNLLQRLGDKAAGTIVVVDRRR